MTNPKKNGKDNKPNFQGSLPHELDVLRNRII